ncbi:hypothetical protein JHL22_01335 [Advenella sp. WQ 585]|uniref:Lipoprotein n=1 Tax=Advenella mandrilli TaxID=2800330 RepID=A0ABS1E8C8_9BURK|nr:hypothetical protein [Advenella mandrilli]MBK1779851.1 hypothetical protein [Advenella mandrilli]
MPLIKTLVAGGMLALLTACGSGSVLYERTDVHLILPCYQDENICLKQMAGRCANELAGKLMDSEIRQEDVPVVYALCRPPQPEAGTNARAAN